YTVNAFPLHALDLSDLEREAAGMVMPKSGAIKLDEDAHPRAPHETRDEIELFLRDAFAAGCRAVWERSLFTAMEYAAREAKVL
ncbi:hypothetical protein NPN14_25140, partial [Vibrio parahaemolyticus]|uniref:hypothetical protein n=1 Tax=Vibrio parahaemolyticus TaxID=670 RepID=UPI002112AAE3